MPRVCGTKQRAACAENLPVAGVVLLSRVTGGILWRALEGAQG